MLRMAVLASGRGSNLQAILTAIENGYLHGEVVVVISDRKDAKALEYARQRRIPAIWVNPALLGENNSYNKLEKKISYENRLFETAIKYQPDCFVLAGYMRILGETFIQKANQLSKPIINIHPALLPAFPGLHAQAQAINYGVRYSGCTVHFVDEGVDTGPIIAQSVVPVLADDDEESLSSRILQEEHQLYYKVLEWLAQGKIHRYGRKVTIE